MSGAGEEADGGSNEVVLDSSFLIAFHNARDAHHPAAVQAMARFRRGVWGQGLLTEYVFLEVVTVIAMRLDHAEAVRVGDLLLDSRELEFIPGSMLFELAFEQFRDPRHSSLSFVDAALVGLAQQRGVDRILTFDRDFASIEGLTSLPGSE